jgi:hypothetical protein
MGTQNHQVTKFKGRLHVRLGSLIFIAFSRFFDELGQSEFTAPFLDFIAKLDVLIGLWSRMSDLGVACSIKVLRPQIMITRYTSVCSISYDYKL